jgi:hypothetical protein
VELTGRTVYLHVGLPKSGTSYLQQLLSTNRARLADVGLLFPGRNWQDQVLAVRDVRKMDAGRVAAGAWPRLVETIAAWPTTSIVSMEWLCAASPEEIRRIVADLAPAQVEVVFTVRDLGRTLPAAWQEFMQGRLSWEWKDFLEGVRSGDPTISGPAKAFWAQQDLGGMIERWGEAVGTGHLHVVTVPPPGAAPDVLWRRLSEVLGVAGVEVNPPRKGRNESLGLESAEVMRRLNPMTREVRISPRPYRFVFKHLLGKTTLAKRRAQESTLAVPLEFHDWVHEATQRQVAAILDSEVAVVGDLADLEPVLADGTQPADLALDGVLDASLVGTMALAEALITTRRREEALRRRVGRLERRIERLEGRLHRHEARVQAFEAAPLRSALRMRAGAVRRRLRR